MRSGQEIRPMIACGAHVMDMELSGDGSILTIASGKEVELNGRSVAVHHALDSPSIATPRSDFWMSIMS